MKRYAVLKSGDVVTEREAREIGETQVSFYMLAESLDAARRHEPGIGKPARKRKGETDERKEEDSRGREDARQEGI